MERVRLESTSLKSVAYEEKALILEIEFAHGGIYRYVDVPKTIYEALLESDSKGRFFLSKIRGNFAYEQIRKRGTDIDTFPNIGGS